MGSVLTFTPAGLDEVPAVAPEYQHLYADRPPAACWVYEVWDTRGRLAYVGIADNFERRWAQHRKSSWWLGEIDVWYIDVYGYRTRWEARQMEAAAINEQQPVYNTSKEGSAYRGYRGLWEDPERPVDDMDCIPVKKRRFVGVR